jgi:DNA-binding NarL/FixJ family response regulator
MDLRLPRAEDGLALLRGLHEAAPSARVVVLAGFKDDLDGRPEQAFASKILSKPIATEQLLEALSTA